ncbi:mitochondrial/chloroplast ribosomal protein L54/L37 [Fomitopsis serialis]|uniref:mitochondrial/chloroplast ribosomal protein L54/L37 n=1 Tax=Fomitopsis serialis TaxID=139415 RepID=UPI002008A262|nr:mitochondrial/chloroplast ribosomal protein L54/L37 [Neoantrodia serialis]KAH9930676.1 mitochondrial/chloroplast ribosomal protein L54/L37 [Neoantrodia serialis]
MSFLRPLRRPLALHAWIPARRCYASASNPAQASSSKAATPAEKSEVVLLKSSCPEGTVLTGLNFLKGQEEVVAQADDAYPDWLWKLTGPRQLPNDGPGGKTEKVALRKENRQRIREQNFLKTQ